MSPLKIQVLPHGEGLPLPTYATPGSAGLDLYSAHSLVILPHRRIPVPTGIAIELPPGTVGYVHARSGRARVEGLALANGVGVVDEDYRGELITLLENTDDYSPIAINRGEKIAQLVVVPVLRVEVQTVEELSPTARGTGGFGSTGR